MQTNFEQIIEAASHLSADEIHKLGEWVRQRESENTQTNGGNNNAKEKVKKFNLAMKWLSENKNKYFGNWICLDGDRLVSSGTDGAKVYSEAIAEGIESPFMEFVKEDEIHYLGGWEKCH